MDPREALILSLKREVGSLQSENERLRSVLHIEDGESQSPINSGEVSKERRKIVTPPQVDLEQLAELEGPQLAELVRLYMQENEALRKENSELFSTREIVVRDQELVCRENERLLKKLEDVNSVCCRSPIIPARPTFSAEMLNQSMNSESSTNIWTNPMNISSATLGNSRISYDQVDHIPESIQKELDKRMIGNRSTDPYRPSSHRRHNSWDGRGDQLEHDSNRYLKGGSDSADSVTSFSRRSRMQASNHASMETENNLTNAGADRRTAAAASPNRRFSFANVASASTVTNSSSPVLPDRNEFSGRCTKMLNRDQRATGTGSSSVSSVLSLSESLLSGPLYEFSPADVKATATNRADTFNLPSLTSHQLRAHPNSMRRDTMTSSNKPDYFGSMVSLDDDDDDLVFSNVASKASHPNKS